MEELNHDIVDYIDSIEITTKKETKYIKDNNWATMQELKAKIAEFDLQDTLVKNAVGHAESLYKLAKADLKHDDVKEALDLLLSAVPLHTSRISSYISESDYLESGLEKGQVKAEMEFQTEANKSLTQIKSKVRKIVYGESTEGVEIPTFNNVRIPLMMSDMMEQRFPEIKEFLAKKKKK
jgi:hypothetical protein